MAIIQISRIQHRRGKREDLPNLSSAELGWCLDTRQLFIGNGELTEGAPSIGSTEILTEYSDLFGKFGTYSYTGLDATSYTAITGPTASTPTLRSLQARLDERVSVKSFGAKGDGVTDDTAAINRALNQLFCEEETPSIRRSLYFPAGVYIISDTIKIPTYASLVGEGKNSTILRQTNSLVTYSVETADSKQQTGANIGTDNAVNPAFILVQDMTFDSLVNVNILHLNRTSNSSFVNVGFSGSLTMPDQNSTTTKAVSISSTTQIRTRNIVFDRCSFSNTKLGMELNVSMENIVFTASDFSEMYEGINVIQGPRGLRITNTLFSFISQHALKVAGDASGVVSAFNTYLDVGDTYLGPQNPITPVIIFESDGNTSIGDFFERDDIVDKSVPRVSFTKTALIQYPKELRMGELRQSFGGEEELSPNASSTSSSITFDYSVSKSYTMDYSIEYAGQYRHGVMKISDENIDDEFTESTGTQLTNYTFGISKNGDLSTLVYSGYVGYDNPAPRMKYAVRYFGLAPSVNTEVPLCISNYIKITLSGPYWGTNSGFIGFNIRNSNGDVTTSETAYNAYLDGPRAPSLFGDIEGIWGDNESIDILETYTFALSNELTYNDIATIEFEWMNPYDGFDVTVELSPNYGGPYTVAGYGRVLAFEESGDPAFPITCLGIVPT